MPKETNKAPLNPGEEIEETENTEENKEETGEKPRAKTPLEMVRERQAQMRGHQNTANRGSNATDLSGPAESYKRRMRQRKSG